MVGITGMKHIFSQDGSSDLQFPICPVPALILEASQMASIASLTLQDIH